MSDFNITEDQFVYNQTSHISNNNINEITNKSLITKDLINPISNEFDITFLIDSTSSMSSPLEALKDQCKNIYNIIKNIFPELELRFGAVFYRDPVDCPGDKNNVYPLTNNMDILKEQISLEKAEGGGDEPEDWVGGFDLALNQINWGNGIRLIIHIADAPAHGSDWSGYRSFHEEENSKLYKIIQKTVDKNIKIIAFQIGGSSLMCFQKFKNEYIKRKGKLYKIFQIRSDLKTNEISLYYKTKVIEAIISAFVP